MRNGHNPNRAEHRNRDPGFKQATWRHSVHPQRLAGTARTPVHEAMPPAVPVDQVEMPVPQVVPIPQVASQIGHVLRLQRIQLLHAQLRTA